MFKFDNIILDLKSRKLSIAEISMKSESNKLIQYFGGKEEGYNTAIQILETNDNFNSKVDRIKKLLNKNECIKDKTRILNGRIHALQTVIKLIDIY